MYTTYTVSLHKKNVFFLSFHCSTPLFPTPPIVSPKFPHVSLGVGGWPLGYEDILLDYVVALFWKSFLFFTVVTVKGCCSFLALSVKLWLINHEALSSIATCLVSYEEVSVIVLQPFCLVVLVQNDDDHQPQAVNRGHLNAQQKKMKLGDQPECAADIQKLCGNPTNNFAVIDCLQSDNLACIIELFVSRLLV